jgi:hypothetical protein
VGPGLTQDVLPHCNSPCHILCVHTLQEDRSQCSRSHRERLHARDVLQGKSCTVELLSDVKAAYQAYSVASRLFTVLSAFACVFVLPLMLALSSQQGVQLTLCELLSNCGKQLTHPALERFVVSPGLAGAWCIVCPVKWS